jgi:hypothetical protein
MRWHERVGRVRDAREQQRRRESHRASKGAQWARQQLSLKHEYTDKPWINGRARATRKLTEMPKLRS